MKRIRLTNDAVIWFRPEDVRIVYHSKPPNKVETFILTLTNGSHYTSNRPAFIQELKELLKYDKTK
jgi:hypothetical protein